MQNAEISFIGCGLNKNAIDAFDKINNIAYLHMLNDIDMLNDILLNSIEDSLHKAYWVKKRNNLFSDSII